MAAVDRGGASPHPRLVRVSPTESRIEVEYVRGHGLAGLPRVPRRPPRHDQRQRRPPAVRASRCSHLALHETYAGHQAERCHKEVALIRERGLLEETIAMVIRRRSRCRQRRPGRARPSSCCSTAPPGRPSRRSCATTGSTSTSRTTARSRRAAEPLGWLGVDAALMLHADGVPPAEVQRLPRQRALIDLDAAERWVRFLGDPASRSYAICYPAGLALCREFVAGDPARFRRCSPSRSGSATSSRRLCRNPTILAPRDSCMPDVSADPRTRQSGARARHRRARSGCPDPRLPRALARGPDVRQPVRLVVHGRRPRPRPLRHGGRRRHHPADRDRPAPAGGHRPDRRPRALPPPRRRRSSRSARSRDTPSAR